jgi:hypothetical protein
MTVLRIHHGFDRCPLTYRAREIAKQIDPKFESWRRIRELLVEMADEIDLGTNATPQVWRPPA